MPDALARAEAEVLRPIDPQRVFIVIDDPSPTQDVVTEEERIRVQRWLEEAFPSRIVKGDV